MAPRALPRWDAADLVISRHYGDGWLKEMRTAVLLVPSAITEGRENNFVINPLHSQFSRISAGEPEEIFGDARLFPRVKLI